MCQMPYKNIHDKRRAARRWARKNAEIQRQKKAAAVATATAAMFEDAPADRAVALISWIERVLKVPAGHSRAGEPLIVPEFARRFFEGVFTHRESLLTVARKNGKSTYLAALMLAHISPGSPLLTPGFRGAVVSLSGIKSRELIRLASELIQSSGLDMVAVKKHPYPRLEYAQMNCTVESLSAEKNVGQASGFDIACIDELGLFPLKAREMVAGIRSSISARNGRIVAISISGFSELLTEFEDRADQAGTYVQSHRPGNPDCAIYDTDAWREANPGLGLIKSEAYMRDAAQIAEANPADAAFFRIHDLNLRGVPEADSLVTVAQWQACEVDELPERRGACYTGIDLGGSVSMCSVAAYWPETGRLDVWGCFPEIPDLATRSVVDGVTGLYERMHNEGSLMLRGTKVADVGAFLSEILPELGPVAALGFDRFRRAEAENVLAEIGYRARFVPRGTGASAKADGSHDVRAFQSAVLQGKIAARETVLMRAALRGATLRYDQAGNPALSKDRIRARIDAVQAAVIAVGLAALDGPRKSRPLRFAMVNAAP